MRILVDTCVWSLALRRFAPDSTAVVRELAELISEQRVLMLGPIRQELLSGIKDQSQFELLKSKLGAFTDTSPEQTDYETAAHFFNICRSKGLQGSNTDFLICAVAGRLSTPIFTTDADFSRYRKHLPIALHQPRY